MAEMPMSGERSCTLRQVPRSLPGRKGTTRKAKKWPPLRAAGIAFGNGAKARLAVTDARKKVIRDQRLLQYRSFRRIPLDRRGIPLFVYPARAILPG